MTEGKTIRGFEYWSFEDSYGEGCSLQESSRAVCENADGTVDDPLGWVWLGIDDPSPQILKSAACKLGIPLPEGEVSGWMPYPIHDDVLISSRMHLNEQQVRELIRRLQLWLDNGQIHEPEEVSE